LKRRETFGLMMINYILDIIWLVDIKCVCVFFLIENLKGGR